MTKQEELEYINKQIEKTLERLNFYYQVNSQQRYYSHAGVRGETQQRKRNGKSQSKYSEIITKINSLKNLLVELKYERECINYDLKKLSHK